MKALKLLTFLMIGIFACIGLNSCENNDPSDNDSGEDTFPTGINSNIVGTWEGGNLRYEDEGLIITFKADGTGVYTLLEDGEEDWTQKFRYKANSHLLAIAEADSDDDDLDNEEDSKIYESYRIDISKKALYIYDFCSEDWILKKK